MQAERSDPAPFERLGQGSRSEDGIGVRRSCGAPGGHKVVTLAVTRLRESTLRRLLLSEGSLGQRACERPHDNSHGGTAHPGGSGPPGPLLASHAQASVCLRASSGVQVAGWPQRSATATRGRRLLPGGARWRVAGSTQKAQGEPRARAAGERSRRSAQRCGDQGAACVTRKTSETAER